MMRNLKGWAALALSAAMVVSMGACGTSDKTDSQASVDSNSSSTTGYDVSGVKKDEKIAKMLPSSVTKDGKLTVGMDTSYAPAEFLAADGKTPVGFDVDIVKALAKTFGLEADPQTSNFDSIIPSIGSKYDIGVSSFTITPERMKAVDFVSIFKAGSTWVVKKGNPRQDRHVRPVRIEDRGADRHHTGGGSQQGRRTVQGGQTSLTSRSCPTSCRPM